MTATGDNGPAPAGLVTYSVKPRGGVVHTLALAETLHGALAARLPAAGHAVSARFTWAASAAEDEEIYASVR